MPTSSSYASSFSKTLSAIFTPSVRNLLKCVLAYTLAACFTFHPRLNAFIGASRSSSHLAATATVFFNPAKSWGGMVQAAGIGITYSIFAVAVCLGSMLTTVWLYERDRIVLARVISLIWWIGGSQFCIAFSKAHFTMPAVTTGTYAIPSLGQYSWRHIVFSCMYFPSRKSLLPRKHYPFHRSG